MGWMHDTRSYSHCFCYCCCCSCFSEPCNRFSSQSPQSYPVSFYYFSPVMRGKERGGCFLHNTRQHNSFPLENSIHHRQCTGGYNAYCASSRSFQNWDNILCMHVCVCVYYTIALKTSHSSRWYGMCLFIAFASDSRVRSAIIMHSCRHIV